MFIDQQGHQCADRRHIRCVVGKVAQHFGVEVGVVCTKRDTVRIFARVEEGNVAWKGSALSAP
jgi:hypothetical protein